MEKEKVRALLREMADIFRDEKLYTEIVDMVGEEALIETMRDEEELLRARMLSAETIITLNSEKYFPEIRKLYIETVPESPFESDELKDLWEGRFDVLRSILWAYKNFRTPALEALFDDIFRHQSRVWQMSSLRMITKLEQHPKLQIIRSKWIELKARA